MERVKEQSPEVQKLIHEVAEILDNVDADTLDEWEREMMRERERKGHGSDTD